MRNFQILCTTMFQKDFSFIHKMNIQSDVIITNQSDETFIEEQIINGHVMKMITTDTRGVGINRNIGMIYASSDICLLADDDMVYRDDYEIRILNEFEKNPKADVIIFNIGTNTPQYNRIPTQTKSFKKLHIWSKNPYGAPRIAFRLNSIKKQNIYFSELFGGGAIFPSGEDSLWITQLLRAGLKIYISPVFIGDVSYDESSWFSNDERYMKFGQGALLEARPVSFKFLYELYYVLRYKGNLSKKDALKWIKNGREGYRKLRPYSYYSDTE